MKALPMIVGHKFLDDVPEMSLAEKDEVIQTLVFDGFDKPLRMRCSSGFAPESARISPLALAELPRTPP